MPFSSNDLPAIVKQLEVMATFDQVKDLFRQRQVVFSAPNWETFVGERLYPAVEKGTITADHLGNLLAQAEEHGSQHVMLYRAPKSRAVASVNEAKVRQGIKHSGFGDILDAPRVLDGADQPTWIEARVELTPNAQPKALVVKQVATREHLERLDEKREGTRMRVEYDIQERRAINLVKLHVDGLVEVRIQTHQRPNYFHEAGQLLLQLNHLLPVSEIKPASITTARNNLFEKRRALASSVRYTNSTLKNSRGNTIVAAAGAGEDGDLFSDKGMTSSLDQFVAHEGYCDASNVWFKVGQKPNGDPKWVHVLLSGKDNEFALTSQCSMKEYEYVLSELRAHNR